jgi:hypothetical protein
LLRMRLAIVSVEQKRKRDAEFIEAHEARGGDPEDPAYARTKFFVGELDKERVTMVVDLEEGHVSVFDYAQHKVTHYLTIEQSDMNISEFHFKAIESFLVQSPKANSTMSIVAELAA